MPTLDRYVDPPGLPRKNVYVLVMHVDVHSIARKPLEDRLLRLVDVIRKLQLREGYARVDWIYRHLFSNDVVRSREQLAELLKLAEHEGLSRTGPAPSSWIAVAKEAPK